MVGVVMAVVSFRAPTHDEGREGTDGRSAARPRVRRSRRGVPERRWRRGPTASRPTRTRARESAGGALREGAQRQRSWRAHDRPRAPGVLWQASRFALDVGLRMAPKRERRPGFLLWKPKRLTVAVETVGYRGRETPLSPGDSARRCSPSAPQPANARRTWSRIPRSE